jgi:hypothetical protein
LTLGRLAKIVFAYWILQWAAGELAAYAGRHWRKPGPSPLESEHPPGHMPGPRL